MRRAHGCGDARFADPKKAASALRAGHWLARCAKLIEVSIEVLVLDFGVVSTIKLSDTLRDRDSQFVELEGLLGAALARESHCHSLRFGFFQPLVAKTSSSMASITLGSHQRRIRRGRSGNPGDIGSTSWE